MKAKIQRSLRIIEYDSNQLRKHLQDIEREGIQVSSSISNSLSMIVYEDFRLKVGLSTLESYIGQTPKILQLKQDHYLLNQELLAYMSENSPNSVSLLWDTLEELLRKYKQGVMDLSLVEYEEFMMIVNQRGSIEALLHYVDGENDNPLFRERMTNEDSILREHEKRQWLNPFSKEEQIRLLLPRSHWWYFSDL